jgi:Regulator of chromosome condensation (RCC1) repeat
MVCAAAIVSWAMACALVADLGPRRTLATDDSGTGNEGRTGDDGATANEVATGDEAASANEGATGDDAPTADQQIDAPEEADASDGGGASLQATVVAVGPTQACAIVDLGPRSLQHNTVRCWGSNGAGELGSDPSSVPFSSTPLPVPGIEASQLTLAAGYACAVISVNNSVNNYLYAWGNVPDLRVRREPGSLAYQPAPMDLYPSPMDPSGTPLAAVTTASVGADGGCCIQMNPYPTLVSWGAFEQAASDAGTIVLDGGAVAVNDSFESVVVGRAHACGIATRHNGLRDVECWGANDRGQVGVPFAARVSNSTPVGLAPLGFIQQVAAGGDDSCALINAPGGPNGVVYCWGANDRGQLGDQVDGGRDLFGPTRVNVPSGVIEIAVGDSHACALRDGAVWCWGDNSADQLGTGVAGASFRATPMMAQTLHAAGPVPFGLAGQIATGGKTTCAIASGDPHVWCWGANDFGQAGQPLASVVPYATLVAW